MRWRIFTMWLITGAFYALGLLTLVIGYSLHRSREGEDRRVGRSLMLVSVALFFTAVIATLSTILVYVGIF